MTDADGRRTATAAALRGDYAAADAGSAAWLESEGAAEVLARGATPNACPAIAQKLDVERGDDGMYRIWLDGAGGLPRPGRPPVAWPTTGFESAWRAVSEARRELRAAAGIKSHDTKNGTPTTER